MPRPKKNQPDDRDRDRMLNFRTFARLAADLDHGIDRLNAEGARDSAGNSLTTSRVLEMLACWLLDAINRGDWHARLREMRAAHVAWLEARDAGLTLPVPMPTSADGEPVIGLGRPTRPDPPKRKTRGA